MHWINLSTLLQLLFIISIAQAIILDPVSLATYSANDQAALRENVEQAFALAFTQASVGTTQMSSPSTSAISDLATWLFGSAGKALAKINLAGISEVNQFISTDKTTTDYGNNPIVYFNLDRFQDAGREDGAMWDSDNSIYAANRAVIEACNDGSGGQPPHTITVNNGPRAIHDTIDICPWYIRWLSQNGWPMTSRWNAPGAVRSLTQSARQIASDLPLTAMDYLQGLDQKLLSAMTLARPVTLSELPAVPSQKLWVDCVNFPNAQNPYSLGFFTCGVQKTELGYSINQAGAIYGYSQPRDPGNKRKRAGSFIQRPKRDGGFLSV